VNQALINGGLWEKITAGQKAYSQWAHELGLDGALADGMKIFVK
jgi:hypothetical protein